MSLPFPTSVSGISHLVPSRLRLLYRTLIWLSTVITVLVFLLMVGTGVIGGVPLNIESLWPVYRFSRKIGLRIAGQFVSVFAPLLIVYPLLHTRQSDGNLSASDDRTETIDTGVVRRRNENGYIIHPDRVAAGMNQRRTSDVHHERD